MSDEPRYSDDVFGLLRDLERASPGKPRIGKALRSTDDIVKFGQSPQSTFAPTSLAIEADGAAGSIAFLRVFFLSLIGPMGPLPLQLSEIALFERRYARERPFGGFLDVLANRMIQLFYRAWADTEPMAQHDRPSDDLFQHYVAALGALADASAHEDPDRLRLALMGFGGQVAARRSPSAIADTASSILGIGVIVIEFVGAWQPMEIQDATRLGRTGRHNALGGSAILGLSVYTVQDGCLVRLRFASLEQYEHHLPSGSGFASASSVLRGLLPRHLDWRMEYEIAADKARLARLDRSTRLGWSGWLGQPPGDAPRHDLRLAPSRGAF